MTVEIAVPETPNSTVRQALVHRQRALPNDIGSWRLDITCHVYMLSSRPHGTLYLGVTRNLGRRMVEHKSATTPGFAAHYGVHRLVWMEDYERIVDAVAREKALKKWRRAWKVALIEAMNPNWDDLFHTLNH